MKNLNSRVQQHKKKRPGYGEVIDFFQKVGEAQEEVKPGLNVDPIQIKKEWKELLTKEGFSLIQRQDFPINIESSVSLFMTLCRIAKNITPLMDEQVKKIEEGIENKGLDLENLLKEGISEQKVEKTADELGLDKKVFSFLIHASIKPSIEAGVDQLRSEIDPETWLKSNCPVCGSFPFLSLLKEAVGKRYLLCSFCGYQWRFDRRLCPSCNNKEQETLHYFCGEGEETCRIDLCDKCHQYIKTIDLRETEDADLLLEDLATLHLDLIAIEKGYKKIGSATLHLFN
ncbi:MAG: hypothetical protein A2169_02445 [Deltaproteobacteria bacterium RBG_13_47_9]|nr:MAG: hypothetical protein A2169_02445 [Deltaproteobacteria bacterium RBG_13_47_9]